MASCFFLLFFTVLTFVYQHQWQKGPSNTTTIAAPKDYETVPRHIKTRHHWGRSRSKRAEGRSTETTLDGTCLVIIGVTHNWQLPTPPQPNLTVIQAYWNAAFHHLFLRNHPSTSPVSTPICTSCVVPRDDVSLLFFISFSFTNLFLDG